MEQSMTTENDIEKDIPEMADLDAIISKVSDMMKTGQVDLEEIKMDLEDFKSKISGEETEEVDDSTEGMSSMIGKMQEGGGMKK